MDNIKKLNDKEKEEIKDCLKEFNNDISEVKENLKEGLYYV